MAAEQIQEIQEIQEPEMSIWEHIGEIRIRLMKAFAALVLTTGISVVYLAPIIIDILSWPAGGKSNFIAIEVTETMGVYMRVALLSGFIMALPVIFYQIVAFIVPGLYDHEKRWLYYSIPIATLLFISGVTFAYYVMLPTALPFLRGFLDITPSWRLSNYIEFVTNLMFWIGASFEAPLLVYILAKFGIVNARWLIQQWRFAIVIIAVLAAIITPTIDPVNMGLLMAPLFAVYMLSVLFASLARPKAKEEEA